MTPSGIAPASMSRLHGGRTSPTHACPASSFSTPALFGMPSSAIDSFTVNGTPSSSGRPSSVCAAHRGTRDSLVDRERLPARVRETVGDHRVEPRVRTLEQLEVRLHHVSRGQLTTPDCRPQRNS